MKKPSNDWEQECWEQGRQGFNAGEPNFYLYPDTIEDLMRCLGWNEAQQDTKRGIGILQRAADYLYVQWTDGDGIDDDVREACEKLDELRDLPGCTNRE